MLPFDIWVDILSYLEYLDLIQISSTNKTIKDACDETSEFAHILIQKIQYENIRGMVYFDFKKMFIDQFGLSLYFHYQKKQNKYPLENFIMDTIFDNKDHSNNDIDHREISSLYDQIFELGKKIFTRFINEFYRKNKNKIDKLFFLNKKGWNDENIITLYNYVPLPYRRYGVNNKYKTLLADKIQFLKPKIEKINYSKILFIFNNPCCGMRVGLFYNVKDSDEIENSSRLSIQNYLENNQLKCSSLLYRVRAEPDYFDDVMCLKNIITYKFPQLK